MSKKILLIVSGSIAAYRSLDLVRNLKRENISVFPVLTKGGSQFLTPLSLQALSQEHCLTDGDWQERGMEHIALARQVDLIVICPASANFIAKAAAGFADEISTAFLLSSTVPILCAPAMNPKMWENPATQDNIALLQKRNIEIIFPQGGEVACGENGMGRLAELTLIQEKILEKLGLQKHKPLAGRKALITAGPTQEPLDPVRFITNHASGKQGYAIAEELANAGAEVVLISGPTVLTPPSNVSLRKTVTACDMEQAVKSALPADIFIGTAAVADWRPEASLEKLKKTQAAPFEKIKWHPNPDILKNLGNSPQRPALLIGFAAETQLLETYAEKKRQEKNCNWILANNVKTGVFNSEFNTISFLSEDGTEYWPRMTKKEVSHRLVQKIINFFSK